MRLRPHLGVGGCGATSDPWGGGDAIADRLAPLGSWPGGMLRPPAPTPTAMLLLLALQYRLAAPPRSMKLPPCLHIVDVGLVVRSLLIKLEQCLSSLADRCRQRVIQDTTSTHFKRLIQSEEIAVQSLTKDWGYIEDKVYRTQPTDLNELRHRISHEAQAIPREYIQNAVAGFYNRLAHCQTTD
ncbi:hypothetical protein J6590_098826, partial [Homalodisca vitripennis]